MYFLSKNQTWFLSVIFECYITVVSVTMYPLNDILHELDRLFYDDFVREKMC